MNFNWNYLNLSMLVLLLGITKGYSQNKTSTDGRVNTITTAVPFVNIGPDSRSGGIGDVGIAISPDANGAFWNVGKMAMINHDFGGGLTYTPWLRDLGIDDIFLAHLDGYAKIGDNQTVGIDFRYFSLGSIQYTDNAGNPLQQGNPREFYIDGYYSRKFSEKFAAGVTLRYIWSGLNIGSVDQYAIYNPGNAVAADFGFFYRNSHKDKLGLGDEFTMGLQVKNLGSKITYTQNNKYFIPTNLGLGFGYTKQIDEYNKITFTTDLNKLLVPTPRDSTGNGDFYIPNETVLEGVFNSFGDAPGGFKEEMQEINIGGGAEYWYQDQFAVRAGYFYENKYKGARQYATLGIGIKYQTLGLNFSYIIPTNSKFGGKMPLSNTLRFSLLFDMNRASDTGGSNSKHGIDQQVSAF